MKPEPLRFARECGTMGPCAQYVAAWLAAQGVDGTPSMREIIRDWRRHGVENGVELWCERIGLRPCPPASFCVVLAAQPGGKPLLGVLDGNGLFVTRSFMRVLIQTNPQIMKAWRV